ncbi:MAG: hypothetical protein KatS3mg096_763 [Candidatus Parcubacteria bacterium]|nr:MAG: hypothetical protein KatS3mg096_763 [Candidatus Parcubacteria bacterium]
MDNILFLAIIGFVLGYIGMDLYRKWSEIKEYRKENLNDIYKQSKLVKKLIEKENSIPIEVKLLDEIFRAIRKQDWDELIDALGVYLTTYPNIPVVKCKGCKTLDFQFKSFLFKGEEWYCEQCGLIKKLEENASKN